MAYDRLLPSGSCKGWIVACLAVLTLAAGCRGGTGSLDGAVSGVEESPPDLILHNGKILTVDGDFSVAEARAGRFTVVGDDERVLATAGPDTRVLDLEGATALPGFNDTHSHLVRWG
jgi:imidazolonepropionase-like amidohydrolase